MKNMLLIVCLGVAFAANSEKPAARPFKVTRSFPLAAAFENIHVHKQGRGVKIQWSVTEASSVSSFDIECTYEDPNDIYSNWNTKASIASSGKKMNMFTDMQDIYAGQVYYRVIAHTNDGDIISEPQPLTIE